MRSLVLIAALLLGGCGGDKPPSPTPPAEPEETPAERLDREYCEKFGGTGLNPRCKEQHEASQRTKPPSNKESYERALDHVRAGYRAEGWFLEQEQPVTILAKGLGSQTFNLQMVEGADFQIIVVSDTAMSLGCQMDIGGHPLDVHLDQRPFEDQEVTINGTGTTDAATTATITFSLYAYRDRAYGQLFVFTRN